MNPPSPHDAIVQFRSHAEGVDAGLDRASRRERRRAMARAVGESVAHAVVALHRDLGVRVPSALTHAPFVRIDLPPLDPADVLQGIFDHPTVERVAVPASGDPTRPAPRGPAAPDTAVTSGVSRVGLVSMGRPAADVPVVWAAGTEGESEAATAAAARVVEGGASECVVWSLAGTAGQFDVLHGVDQVLRAGADVVHVDLPRRAVDSDAGWQLLPAGLGALASFAAVPVFAPWTPAWSGLAEDPRIILVSAADPDADSGAAGTGADLTVPGSAGLASLRAAAAAGRAFAACPHGWTKPELLSRVTEIVSASRNGSA